MEGIWGLLEDWTVRCDISLKCKSNTLCNMVTHALELFKKAEMEGERETTTTTTKPQPPPPTTTKIREGSLPVQQIKIISHLKQYDSSDYNLINTNLLT